MASKCVSSWLPARGRMSVVGGGTQSDRRSGSAHGRDAWRRSERRGSERGSERGSARRFGANAFGWRRALTAKVGDPALSTALVGEAAVEDAIIKHETVARSHRLRTAPPHRRLAPTTRDLRALEQVGRDLTLSLVEQIVAI